MPKVLSIFEREREFGKEGFYIFDKVKKIMMCKLCNTRVDWFRKDTCLKHINSALHKRKKSNVFESSKQATLENSLIKSKNSKEDRKEFIMDTTKTFMEANIPIEKLDHPSMRCWMDKYVKAIETISDLPLNKTTVIKEQSISVSPYHDFYQRHLRFNDVQNRLADTSGDLEAALRMGAMLILRWQSTIKNNGSNGRTVIGQHHVAIDKLDVSATWPPESSPALQMQEQQGPLYIFGPDVISSATSAMSDKYPSLDVLQRLVTYSIHHPPSIAHDFKHSRLCVVPVRLHLQNCSDSHLVIKVTTVGNSSSSSLTNKNQLYSPHSSGCFRWVGLACSNLELSPHASESVCLSAAFGSPGTFNLGTRLEVWCRSRGAPEADSVTQSWRVESSLIVCSTS